MWGLQLGKAPRDEGTGAGFGGQLGLDLGVEAGLEFGFKIRGLDSGTGGMVSTEGEGQV